MTAAELELVVDAIVPLVKRTIEASIAELRAGLVGLEARALIPGPPGRDGRDGRDGAPAGVSAEVTAPVAGPELEALEVTYDGERGIVFSARAGETVKTWPFTLPVPIYRGVWAADGARYVAGDVVTRAGSLWIARTSTAAVPGEGSPDWTLAVKAGRPGREGKAGPVGPPGRSAEVARW